MAETTELSLKDQGNKLFQEGNFLKAAAVYTQAIKQDPDNAVLYRHVTLELDDAKPGFMPTTVYLTFNM